jgi:hypothetical protein
MVLSHFLRLARLALSGSQLRCEVNVEAAVLARQLGGGVTVAPRRAGWKKGNGK